jgi:hypothetical protein
VGRRLDDVALVLLSALAALVGLTACATDTPLVIQEVIGPERPLLPGEVTMDGTLVVNTPTYAATFAQSEYPVHTDYTLLSRDQKVIQRVANRTGSFESNPVKVPLSPGEYRVQASLQRGGLVIVPVVVVAGQVTVVDLDGTALPQNLPCDGNWVRLPDGHVVGRRAPAQ